MKLLLVTGINSEIILFHPFISHFRQNNISPLSSSPSSSTSVVIWSAEDFSQLFRWSRPSEHSVVAFTGSIVNGYTRGLLGGKFE
jgi:hypothetical protein